jgi:hypothetical protein
LSIYREILGKVGKSANKPKKEPAWSKKPEGSDYPRDTVYGQRYMGKAPANQNSAPKTTPLQSKAKPKVSQKGQSKNSVSVSVPQKPFRGGGGYRIQGGGFLFDIPGKKLNQSKLKPYRLE